MQHLIKKNREKIQSRRQKFARYNHPLCGSKAQFDVRFTDCACEEIEKLRVLLSTKMTDSRRVPTDH